MEANHKKDEPQKQRKEEKHMPHIYWIKNCAPKSCADCTDGGCRCPLDESMPCSPDCEELDPETGQPSMSEFCKTSCDAIKE